MAISHQDSVIFDSCGQSSCPALLHWPRLQVCCRSLIAAADAGTGPGALLLSGQALRGFQELPFTVVYLSVLVKITGVCGPS